MSSFAIKNSRGDGMEKCFSGQMELGGLWESSGRYQMHKLEISATGDLRGPTSSTHNHDYNHHQTGLHSLKLLSVCKDEVWQYGSS